MLLFFVIGVPSNFWIIVSILLGKLYREPTHLLLLSLACADLLICVMVMPLIIVSGYAGEFVFGDNDSTRCKVCQTGMSFMVLVIFSLHALALMSVDRFLFVKYPLRYDKIVSQKTVLALITVVFTLSVTLGILPLFGLGEIHFDHATFSCTPRFESETTVTKNIYYLVIIVAEALLPLSILTVTNIWVLWIAQKHIKEIYNTKQSITDTSKQKAYLLALRTKITQPKFRKQLQLVRVFGVILISHMIVWIPLIIRTLEAIASGSDDFSPWSNFIVITSIMFHPVLHPLVEACFLPTTRKQLSVLCKKCCKLDPTLESTCCHCSCVEIISAALLPKAEETDP